MRVLYLWNTAGVFTPVAEWLVEQGHEAKIVMRSVWDIYKQTSCSDLAVMVDTSRDFLKMGVRLIREWRPDIIHVSGTRKMLVLARLLAPRGIIVFSYHGSDARNPKKKPHRETKLADFVHVSTPDLNPYGTWIDRPIDPKFYDRGGRVVGSALMFYRKTFYDDNRKHASKWCRERDYTLTILDENYKDFPIPYVKMPEFLSRYEYYLDWKGQRGELSAFSKAALEALACGCKVVHDDDFETVITAADIEWARPVHYYDLYVQLLKERSVWRALRRVPVLLLSLTKWAFSKVRIKKEAEKK